MTFSNLVIHTASATTIMVNVCTPQGTSHFNISPRDYISSASEGMRKVRMATWDSEVSNIHPLGPDFMEVTLYLKDLVII